MSDKVLKILNERTQFLNLLDQEITKNRNIFDENSEKLKFLKNTCENLRELGKYPEHTALIPLCKNLYMPGKIIHTGEYLVTKKAYPNSYSVLKTLDQTLADLSRDVKEQEAALETAEQCKIQLEERKKILIGESSENTEDERPKEIKSDKGVAVKVGDFYEILEYED